MKIALLVEKKETYKYLQIEVKTCKVNKHWQDEVKSRQRNLVGLKTFIMSFYSEFRYEKENPLLFLQSYLSTL